VAQHLWDKLMSGGDFWEVVQRPFRAHEVTRAELAALIDRGLQETRGSYRALVRLFNLPASDYKRFHAFLYQQNCNLPVGPYRTARATMRRQDRPPPPHGSTDQPAPAPDDPRQVNFAFVSCQDVNESKLNGYRRMIFEDERAQPEDQLDFVLHLGDFIYEVVQYPEEGKPRFDRKLYEVARIPDALKVRTFHLPTTLAGYRAVWKGYLADPDLQDARARWPFVCIWDNHEFSWQGWQSILKAPSIEQPAQAIKVAANQAWFENIPARVKAPSGSFDEFGSVPVKNVKIEKFDDDGLGLEPNNIAAINSLIVYRALRYGRHLDLLLTDEHSYRGPTPFDDPGPEKLADWGDFDGMFPDDLLQALDGGRAFNGGNPPAEMEFNGVKIANPRKDKPPQAILGAKQKAWFKDRLRSSSATWKIWGSSQGNLEQRADPENLSRIV